MPHFTGDFRENFKARMIKEINTNISKRMDAGEWKEIMKKGSINAEYQESRQDEAMGPAQMIGEGGMPPEAIVREGYSKRKAIQEVGLRAVYTRRVKKLDKRKLIAKITKNLAMSPNQYLENIAANYIEYSDTALASVPTVNGLPIIDSIGGDGLTLAHETHTFKSDMANTYSNKTASLQSLTQDVLQTMTNAVLNWTQNTGELLDVDVKRVIVPVAHQWKIYELLHSETKSETANRSDNALRQHYGKASFYVYRHQINQDEFMLETNVENDYEMLFGWDPNIEDKYDSETGNTTLTLNFAVAHGVNDPRRYYFNKT